MPYGLVCNPCIYIHVMDTRSPWSNSFTQRDPRLPRNAREDLVVSVSGTSIWPLVARFKHATVEMRPSGVRV